MLDFLIENWPMTLAAAAVVLLAIGGVVYGVVTRGNWLDRGFMLRDGRRLRWPSERIPLAVSFVELPPEVEGAVRLAITAVAGVLDREVLREFAPIELGKPDVVVRAFVGESAGSTSLEFDRRSGEIRFAEVRIDPTIELAVLPAVALHEIGHVLGLDHDESRSSVMHPTVSARPSELTEADRELLRKSYGLT